MSWLALLLPFFLPGNSIAIFLFDVRAQTDATLAVGCDARAIFQRYRLYLRRMIVVQSLRQGFEAALRRHARCSVPTDVLSYPYAVAN